MNERDKFNPKEVDAIGVNEQGGKIVQRDLLLRFGNHTFILSVGTEDYLQNLKEYNKNFPDEEKLDENILVLPNVEKIEDVVKTLRKLDADDVVPFLVEQEEDEG